MKPITHKQLIELMEEDDWEMLHNATCSAMHRAGLRPDFDALNIGMLTHVLTHLPVHVRAAALQFGFVDGGVRDKVIEALESKFKAAGSLAALPKLDGE